MWDLFEYTKTLARPGAVRQGSRFSFLLLFSWLSALFIASAASGVGYITTQFMMRESIERDSILSAQFIQDIAEVEVDHAGIPMLPAMGELLSSYQHHDSFSTFNFEDERIKKARNEFLDHISHLPDLLLSNIYSRERVIVWSTNPDLIGQKVTDNEELELTFNSQRQVSSGYMKVDNGRIEQKFLWLPEELYIENYIPLLDVDDTVLSVVEVYKEPKDLNERIQRGYVVIWQAVVLGGGLMYLGLFWIVYRASVKLASQQQQLIANETFVALGEMSSAVAHSLRNPLAAIRSSAELTLELSAPPIHKNINDIINQVDRMSQWIRDLLVSSPSLNGDSEAVDPLPVIQEALLAFEPQIKNANIQVECDIKQTPLVVSRRVLLTQVFNSLIANAIEAMPDGGLLRITIEQDSSQRCFHLTISDSGKGMSQRQRIMAFKPFYTTKQGGVGVGLMLVKRLMERFGGQVKLTSCEQEGTKVSLRFKVAKGGRNGTQYIDRRR
ncbi:two-component system sensor histidine kinase HydH [Oceanisphaera litoralis]|uniref:sensor histidine kinase n=1 Tax=Oceanisphaera litoralis TaxID=225144 RepID=UPI00195ACA20|nr:HAMP domain-containing sensor histidine kinase [Oceanisphaera litoralis]MBM7455974.1 two-component system sensor histidine kinase HydH [Oceanisphaera litoralis]